MTDKPRHHFIATILTNEGWKAVFANEAILGASGVAHVALYYKALARGKRDNLTASFNAQMGAINLDGVFFLKAEQVQKGMPDKEDIRNRAAYERAAERLAEREAGEIIEAKTTHSAQLVR